MLNAPLGKRQFILTLLKTGALVGFRAPSGMLAGMEMTPRPNTDKDPVNIAEFLPAIRGSADDDALHRALAVIGPNRGTIWFPSGDYRFAGVIEQPSQTSLVVSPGARIALGPGSHLNLRGEFRASAHPIFAGPGRVTWHTPQTIIPDWFSADPYSQDDSSAVQSAIDAAAGRSTVLLARPSYSFDRGVSIPAQKPLRLEGANGMTELIMSPRFRATDGLITYTGSATSRNENQVIRGLHIRGQGSGDTDGVGVVSDFSTNFLLEDLFFENIRNSAIRLAHAWDAKLLKIRIYGCGNIRRDAPAMIVGQPTTALAGWQNANAVNLDLVTVERSFGVGIDVLNATNITLVNCKLHGRIPTDPDPTSSRELLSVDNSRLLRVVGCEFTQARTDATSGAVRIRGNQCGVLLTGSTFDRIGDDDTYAIYIDTQSAESRCVLDSLMFNDARKNTPYIFTSAAARAGVILDSSISYKSPQAALRVSQ